MKNSINSHSFTSKDHKLVMSRYRSSLREQHNTIGNSSKALTTLHEFRKEILRKNCKFYIWNSENSALLLIKLKLNFRISHSNVSVINWKTNCKTSSKYYKFNLKHSPIQMMEYLTFCKRKIPLFCWYIFTSSVELWWYCLSNENFRRPTKIINFSIPTRSDISLISYFSYFHWS